MRNVRVAVATLLATTALSSALIAAPASAADNAANTAAQIQMLQDQLRTLQQQLDAIKANSQATSQAVLDAVARESKERQAADNAAANAVPPKTAHVTESGAHKFLLESADGAYSIALTGRLHFDMGTYVNFKPSTTAVGTQHLSSGVNARRARIGVTGKIANDWSYTFIYDGGNSQDTAAGGIQQAQVTYNGFKNVIIDLPGYSEPPFTMETAMSSNDIVFMERATPSNLAAGLNAGDFRSNTGIRFIDDRYWIGAYLTGPQASADSHTNVNERFGAFQRASVQLLTGPDYTLHLGGALDELIQAPNVPAVAPVPAGAPPVTPGQITLSDRPEIRIDPTALLSTGALGTVANPVTGALIYNVEAAATFGSFFAQAEYDHFKVDRRGLTSNNFEGGYVMATYTLTGEHRAYNRATGAYGSITPAHPFNMNGGTGAWEIAARFSYTDLRDGVTPGLALPVNGVNGGLQQNYTLGVNWYVNTYMRFMLDFVHSDIKKTQTSAGNALAPLGSPIGYQLDAIGLRTQLAW